MAGKAAGKIHCGSPLDHKACAGCFGVPSRDTPTGAPCPKCGRPLLPWCEMMVVPGTYCKFHPDTAARHPDAPLTHEDTMAYRLNSVVAVLSPEQRADLEALKGQPMSELARRAAELRYLKAVQSQDPNDLDKAVYAALGAQKIKDLE